MAKIDIPSAPDNSKFRGPTEKAGAEKPRHKDSEKQVLKQVANGTIQKAPTSKKIWNAFFKNDFKTCISNIAEDVIVPTIKNAIWTVITDGVDMMLFNGDRRASRNDHNSRTRYNTIYGRPGEITRSMDRDPRDTVPALGDIKFASYNKAKTVLNELEDAIMEYGYARLTNVYELVGMSCHHTYYNWGWNDLRDARIKNVGNAWVLILPRPKPIDR